MKDRATGKRPRADASACQAVRESLQRIEQALVKFGARLPIRGGNSGVQHGLSIALSLVRDELDGIDMAAAVVQPPEAPVAQPPPSQAPQAVQTKASAPPDWQTLPDDAYIRQAQLIGGVLPVSNTTLWRWVRAGTFPAPVALGARMAAWRVGDVRAWMQARKASADR